MSGGVNKATLLGHLGRDPEVRMTRAGDPVATFSLATSERWTDKTTGERKERTEWHNVIVYNEGLVKIVEQYLKKGLLVYLEGKIATREYEGRDGIKRKTTEIVLARFRGDIQILTSQSNRPPPADGPDDYGRTQTREPAAAPQSAGEIIDDDIPF